MAANSVKSKVDALKFFGDADRLYLLDQKGMLSSYDIRTGKLLQSKHFGSHVARQPAEHRLHRHRQRLAGTLGRDRDRSGQAVLCPDRPGHA